MTWKPFNPADYSIGSPLYIAGSGWRRDVIEYTVTKVTPSGQVVGTYTFPHGHTIEVRVNNRGRIVGDGTWSRRSVVTAEDAAEIRREANIVDLWRAITDRAEEVGKAARQKDEAALDAAFAALAQAIEARRAATAKTGAVEDESAVLKGCAHD